METIKKYLDEIGYEKVVLRAFRHKPLVRYATRRNDGIVMVRNERSMNEFSRGLAKDDWIGWPIEDVYRFDESIYEKLSALYEKGETQELDRTWKELKRRF